MTRFLTPELRAREAVGDWAPRDVIAPYLLENLWWRIERAITAAVAEEREQCAQAVDALPVMVAPTGPTLNAVEAGALLMQVAAAKTIRARGEVPAEGGRP